MKIKIWLDDERDPKDEKTKELFRSKGDEVWIKNSIECIELIDQNRDNIELISFDHDLGIGCGTGMDVVNWIEKEVYTNGLPPFEWRLHSQNVVGCRNMMAALKNCNKIWLERFGFKPKQRDVCVLKIARFD